MIVRWSLFPVCLIFTIVCSAADRCPVDSLSVFLAGDADATFQQPSGFKGSEDGFLRVTAVHDFNNDFSATIGVRGYRSLPVPFLEQGALTWKNPACELSGGFLTDRYGAERYYKTYSTANPLFEKPLVLDAYGFGLGGSSRPGIFVVQGAALINNRESGTAFGYTGIEIPGFRAGFLASLQTYSVDDQDNDLTLGFESSLEGTLLKIHCALKYLHGFGYSATATTLPPGNNFDGFCEARITPLPTLTLDMLTLYRYSKKWYEHSDAMAGVDAAWRFLPWLGIGGGTEWLWSDGVHTLAPEAYLFVVPVRDCSRFSIGFKQSRTMASSPLDQLTGNVCVSF
jgi:hypothetical protein